MRRRCKAPFLKVEQVRAKERTSETSERQLHTRCRTSTTCSKCGLSETRVQGRAPSGSGSRQGYQHGSQPLLYKPCPNICAAELEVIAGVSIVNDVVLDLLRCCTGPLSPNQISVEYLPSALLGIAGSDCVLFDASARIRPSVGSRFSESVGLPSWLLYVV